MNSEQRSIVDRFAIFRQSFPCFSQRRYMSIASRGILSITTRKSIETALDDQMYGRIDKALWKSQAESARSRVAQLFRVLPNEIALTKNVSEGLNIISNAIEWTSGSNIVCCLEYEHPNAVYAMLNLSRHGVEIRNIPMRSGKLDLAAMVKAIDSDTKLLTISAVNFSSGERTDLAVLGEAARKKGALFLVDGAQSAGILDIDLRANMVDAYAVSSNKGLLGLYGLGFLFCDERWSDRLTPAYLSRFGIAAEGYEDSEVGPSDYQLYPNAKRFDLGNSNYIALIAASASLGQLLELGMHDIEKHAITLAIKLREGLKNTGYQVDGCEHLPSSHIVSITTSSDNACQIERLKQELQRNDIAFAVRRGAVRFGLHAYNNDSDVSSVIELASQCAGR